MVMNIRKISENYKTHNLTIPTHTSEKFSHHFTRQFGLDQPHPPAKIRIHILLTQARGEKALDDSLAISFPMCGQDSQQWDLDEAMATIQAQTIFFLSP